MKFRSYKPTPLAPPIPTSAQTVDKVHQLPDHVVNPTHQQLIDYRGHKRTASFLNRNHHSSRRWKLKKNNQTASKHNSKRDLTKKILEILHKLK